MNSFQTKSRQIISRRLPVHLQVLAGALIVAVPCVRAQDVAPIEAASQIAPARVSLRLQKMPLSQMLKLLGLQSGLRFRYAAIPDAPATLSLEDAPLHSAVRDVVATLGFAIQNGQKPDVISAHTWWLWRETAQSGDKPTGIQPGATWQMWKGAQPPHALWMKPPSPRIGEFSGSVGSASRSGVPGVSPVGVQVRWRDNAKLSEEPFWTETIVEFRDDMSPGAQVNWKLDSIAKDFSPRLRWPLGLREVPNRVQLGIETDRPATLWVNGARVLRNWTGMRRVELGSSLQIGTNLLAIEWEKPATVEANAPQIAPSAPLLRYEWFVGE